MAGPADVPVKVGGLIPYFFYDLYGRILPGLFLLCGLFAAWWRNGRTEVLTAGIHDAHASEWIVGSAVMLGACFMVGFLLSELTRITLWRLKIPVSLKDVREHFGASMNNDSAIESAFESYFGFRLDHTTTDNAYLIYCGRLCEFVVVSQNPAMDAVTVRVGAEELLSRSLFAASLILLLVNAWTCNWGLFFFGYLIIAGLSYLSYQHYRRKGILEKFQMFFALTRGNAQHTSTPKQSH